MKKYITYLILIIITTLLIYNKYSKNTDTNYINLQKSISQKIIRFHIIGNSNSEYDQSLKLHIKNAIVQALEPILYNVDNISSARKIIYKNLHFINQIAKRELSKHNSSYSVKTTMSTRFFPIKQYGDMTLPEGEYESVCVELGDAEGKNWWCVLYPSLCFIDCTYSILPTESKDKLSDVLSSDEYNYIINSNNTTIHYKSAISTFLKKHLSLN